MPKRKPKYYVASFSGGKDSTAMVLRLIEIGEPLDEVLFCDTTMEFPAMLRHVEKVKKVVEEEGIKFTTLRAKHDFEYYMLHHRPKRKKPDLREMVGYSWPGPRSRWCTRGLKVDIIDRYLRQLREHYEVIQYIGIAADEPERLERENNKKEGILFPLNEWGWMEADALGYCYSKGYDWEGLYDIFDRVSCWLCPLQSLDDLRKLRKHFPELWEHLRELDDATWQKFKREGSVRELDLRFDLEEALLAAGEKITNRAFYTDLRRVLARDATIEGILAEREPKQLTLFEEGLQ